MNVTNSYFNIVRYREIDEKIRERIYCYELYHQLRCQLDKYSYKNINNYILHGEYDKSHQSYVVEKCKKWYVPDFIFHIPNSPRNFIAIEVKTITNLTLETARKDLKKFNCYIKIGYQQCIFLIAGNKNNDYDFKLISGLKPKIDNDITCDINNNFPLTNILWHKQINELYIFSYNKNGELLYTIWINK